MWILPKQLHTSAYVPATAALSLDLSESSQLCAQSLFVRSSPSLLRTWSAKWKRDSWTQHLFGRILKPSLGKAFETAWTSLLEATPANHSQQQENGLEAKTPGTCGRISQEAFQFFNQESASLKTSRATLPAGCITFCATWEDWVTERRGAYSQRLNAVRHTRGSGSSSWPTAATRDYKGQSGSGRQERKGHPADTLPNAMAQWPSPVASEVRQGFQDRSRGMKGSQESLTTVVIKSWLTPQCGDATGSTQDAVVMWANGQRPKTCDQRLRTQVAAEQLKHGQAAPESSSTDGSRPGWLTPQVQDSKHSGANPTENGDRDLLVNQVNWQTATVSTGAHKQKDGSMTDKLDQQVKSWATARSGMARGNNFTYDRGKGNIEEQAGASVQGGGKLNSRWVEILMNLPIGWTMPSCASPVTIEPTNSASSVTEMSQQPPL